MKLRTETVFGGAQRKQGSNGKAVVHESMRRVGTQSTKKTPTSKSSSIANPSQ